MDERIGSMSDVFKCSLCEADVRLFLDYKKKSYYQCSNCDAVMLDPEAYLSTGDEEARYQGHNNDVMDSGYQEFVSPVVNAVKAMFTPSQVGLDFGAGTGPVITKLLADDGYSVQLYDPFFWNDPKKLEQQYDFIVCCEVMEHFHSPAAEFKLLKSLLKPGGALVMMTHLYHEGINFDHWYYKNDPTHVFFYHQKSLEWIKKQYGFADLKVDGRLIIFSA